MVQDVVHKNFIVEEAIVGIVNGYLTLESRVGFISSWIFIGNKIV